MKILIEFFNSKFITPSFNVVYDRMVKDKHEWEGTGHHKIYDGKNLQKYLALQRRKNQIEKEINKLEKQILKEVRS